MNTTIPKKLQRTHAEAQAGTWRVVLDADHPGFRDAAYRRRRDAIAAAARAYKGGPVPRVRYSAAEHGVWQQVYTALHAWHARGACRWIRAAQRRLKLDATRVPQLADLNPILRTTTGFRMTPVEGLIAARPFLEALGRGVFLATQYIRHPSAPFYTPEPDVVHEVLGHAASLTHPRIAAWNRRIGRAAALANDAGVRALERVYWYTLEFGLVREAGVPRALGAGVLSSVDEMQRALDDPPIRPWDLDAMAATPYDPTHLQPHYFVAPAIERLERDLEAWIRARFPGA